MWLSERAAAKSRSASVAEVGTATGGMSVCTDAEKRNLPVYSPGGYAWSPKFGDDVLVMKCADGLSRVVSAVCEPHEGMENGEILIYSCGASICLKNDGRILFNGDVYINGEPFTGTGGKVGA